jgi:hypothetical protein
MKRISWSLLVSVLAAPLAIPQDIGSAATKVYATTQITSGLQDHRWPSINNAGNIVWSQQVTGSCASSLCWQVFEASGSGINQVTFDSYNHSYPVIDDAGDIVYLKDGSGAGPGLEVALLSLGIESTIEYSSGNPPGCTEPPAGPPTCTSWRSAGMHFGLSKVTKQIISYHDFCSPICARTFDVSGFGQFNGLPGAADYPDINDNGDIAYWDGTGNVFKTNLNGATPTMIASGLESRINDFGDVILASASQVQVYPAKTYPLAATFVGDWTDRNNSCILVFENRDAAGHYQVFQAQTCGTTSAASNTTPTVCRKCDVNPNSIGYGWPKNSTVQVVISSSWTPDQISAITQAFNEWNDANTVDGSEVKFQIGGSPTGYTHRVVNQKCPSNPNCPLSTPLTSNSCTCYTLGPAPTFSGAVTYLYPKYNIYDEIVGIMAHEIGHGMSLDDCDSCKTGDSVMTGLQMYNSNVVSSTTPSSCDEYSVQTFYAGLPHD